MSDDKIFVDGLFIKEVPDTAPPYILGNYSVNIERFKKWLDANEQHAVKGWLNITVKLGKTGTRYAELDRYKPKENTEHNTPHPEIADEVNPSKIPF